LTVNSEQTMETQNRIKLNPKVLVLALAASAAALGLGVSLERIFALGFTLDLALWMRFIPLILFFGVSAAFLTVLSLTVPMLWRVVGIVLAALAFGLPFSLPPQPVEIPLPFVALLPLVFGAGAITLDYYVRRAVKMSATFGGGIFASAYAKLFLFFVLAVGVLVYFSAQLAPQARFTIPEEILAPSLNLVVNRVIEQVQGELGSTQFTEEEFIKQLKEIGLLSVLEEQFGIVLDPGQIGTPEKLAENLRDPLVARLTADLEGLLEPYLPFLPLIAAGGAALSLLFLSPAFAYLAVGAFALTYRVLVWLKFARLEPELREVPVLKIG